MPSEAEITLQEEIPLILSAVDKVTGLPVKSTLSNVQWNQDNAIGEILPDASNPNLAIFKASKAGITHISATATVTIS